MYVWVCERNTNCAHGARPTELEPFSKFKFIVFFPSGSFIRGTDIFGAVRARHQLELAAVQAYVLCFPVDGMVFILANIRNSPTISVCWVFFFCVPNRGEDVFCPLFMVFR